jgi:hypothetical protein
VTAHNDSKQQGREKDTENIETREEKKGRERKGFRDTTRSSREGTAS